MIRNKYRIDKFELECIRIKISNIAASDINWEITMYILNDEVVGILKTLRIVFFLNLRCVYATIYYIRIWE